jgi:hypothetical protein
MQAAQQGSRADQVRRFVLERLVEPSRAAGERTVTVRAGDVQRALGWWNRVPSVCSALDGQEFQRMSRTRLVERRGPAQSTTAEWVFALSETPGPVGGKQSRGAVEVSQARRLLATWDGEAFRPLTGTEAWEPGERVILTVSAAGDGRVMAGEFAAFVGTLSKEEASEMQEVIDSAFETVSDEW